VHVCVRAHVCACVDAPCVRHLHVCARAHVCARVDAPCEGHLRVSALFCACSLACSRGMPLAVSPLSLSMYPSLSSAPPPSPVSTNSGLCIPPNPFALLPPRCLCVADSIAQSVLLHRLLLLGLSESHEDCQGISSTPFGVVGLCFLAAPAVL
jgi:hypothetical protein